MDNTNYMNNTKIKFYEKSYNDTIKDGGKPLELTEEELNIKITEIGKEKDKNFTFKYVNRKLPSKETIKSNIQSCTEAITPMLKEYLTTEEKTGIIEQLQTNNNIIDLLENNNLKILDGKAEDYFGIHLTCKTMGYGLVALKDIPEGTILFLYEGDKILKEENIDPNDEYMYNSTDTLITSKKMGNLSRFCCHLPDDQPFPDDKKNNNMLLSNMDVYNIPYDSLIRGFFITKKDIKIGNEMGWDYGPKYALSNNTVYYNLNTNKFCRKEKEQGQNQNTKKTNFSDNDPTNQKKEQQQQQQQ